MSFVIGKNCSIDPTAVINVKHGYLGDGSIVRAGVRIEGTKVETGREAFFDLGAIVGGGSCFDPCAFLKVGDWFHMGTNSQVNISRGVTAGHEVGVGIETKIFTHGAFIDTYNLGGPVGWAPVVIGNNVMIRNAWVHPGVVIGDNVVVSAQSLINQNLPSGCMAGGAPVKIIKKAYYPRILPDVEKISLLESILDDAWQRYCNSVDNLLPRDQRPYKVCLDEIHITFEKLNTIFNVKEKSITGAANEFSALVKDQLRRNGIRFRYEIKNAQWHPWQLI